MVIRDTPDNSKKKTNGDPKAVRCARENFDTIKLDPKTLIRLKHWHYGNRASLPETVTYDEVLNILLDKVENHQQQLSIK